MSYIGIPPFGQTVRTVTTITATASQTVFTPNGGYTVGYVDVYYNGIKLVGGADFTATNGTTVTLTSGAIANAVIEIVAYGSVSIADAVRRSGDTFAGDVVFAANTTHAGPASFTQSVTSNTLTVSTNTATIGTSLYTVANGNIGFGTDTPIAKLELVGAANAASAIIKVGANNNGGIVWRSSNNTSVGYIAVGANSVTYTSTNDGTGAYLQKSGISFPAVQIASADANTLDDYEEGSFTPEIKCTSANGTRTYGYQNGYYVKIGKLVWVYFDIGIASWSGASGSSYIDVPFTNANLSQNYSAFVPWDVSTNFTGTTQRAAGYIINNGTALYLYKYNNQNSSIGSGMNINTTGRISGVITYRSES